MSERLECQNMANNVTLCDIVCHYLSFRASERRVRAARQGLCTLNETMIKIDFREKIIR